MKKLHTYLKIIFLFLIAVSVNAQKTFYGTVVYNYELDEGAAMMAAFMPKSMNVIYGEDAMMTYMSGGMISDMMGKVVVNKKRAYSLNEQEKVAYIMSSDELESAEKDSLIQVRLIPDNMETIAGYACDLYEVTMLKEGKEIKQKIWTTKELEAPKFSLSGLSALNTGLAKDGLEGFPLKVEVAIEQMQGHVILTASTIEFGKPDSDFFDIPKDYSEKPFSEMFNMNK